MSQVADLEKLISAKNCGPIMSGAQPGKVLLRDFHLEYSVTAGAR